MLPEEVIRRELNLLRAHRRTLAIYLTQVAILGMGYTPPGVIHGIEEARREIERLKVALRKNGVKVPDESQDYPTTSERIRKYIVSPISLLAICVLVLITLLSIDTQRDRNPFKQTTSILPTSLATKATLISESTPIIPTSVVDKDLPTETIATTLSSPCFPPDVRALIPAEGVITTNLIQYLDMDNDGSDEVAILSSNSERKVYFDILRCPTSDATWRNDLHMDVSSSEWCFPPGEGWQLLKAELTKDQRKQVLIVSSSCGSGLFHFYWLIGFNGKDSPEILLSEKELYMSQISLVDGQLMVRTGGNVSRYEWNGNAFDTINVGIPPKANAVIVNYWWNKGKAMTDATNNKITLRVGQVVYFRRDIKLDDSKHLTRTLLNTGNDSITPINEDGIVGLVAKKVGKASAQIIPGGYGINGVDELNISIEVIPIR